MYFFIEIITFLNILNMIIIYNFNSTFFFKFHTSIDGSYSQILQMEFGPGMLSNLQCALKVKQDRLIISDKL